MSSRIVAGLVMALGLHGPALAQGTVPISAVVLYPGSATIMRTSQVTPGMTQVEVPGLPAGFDTQTLKVEADSGIRVGQIITQDTGRTEAANPAEAALETKIQALQDQQASLDAQARSAEIVRNYLERFGGNSGGDKERPHPAIDARTLAGLVDTIGRSASEALERIQRVTVQKREIDKQIQALQHDLSRLRSGTRNTRTVTVNFTATRPGQLTISYQVANAGWKPAYRAALDSAASRVELERLAAISQKTGEEWSKVKLTLSTSQPRQSPQAPEPEPWLLSWQPPRQVVQAVPQPAMSPAPAPAAKRTRAIVYGEEAAAEPAYEPPTFETQSGFASEFQVPARVSLPADGREVSVSLASQVLPVRQRLRVAPRIARAAVVTAEAERPAGVWLPGNLQLFRDGNYVGAAPWDPQAAKQFMLSFGRDELLRVSVEQLKGQSGTTGVFGKRGERRVVEAFKLTSAHKTPVDVLVLESSPVSTAEEVRVQATFEPKPTTEAWEQRRGIVAWERTIAPGETARFSVDYTIEFPQEGYVSGLR